MREFAEEFLGNALAIEPLELGGQQLTVAVVDALEVDRLVAGMVAVSDEGPVIGMGDTKRAPSPTKRSTGWSRGCRPAP